MKIISVDNFDREQIGTSDDQLIADRVDPRYIDDLVKALNDRYCADDHADRFFKAVSDDYVLREYRP